MKAITLIQPWASLIVDGRKAIETRGWPTGYRGRVAIHAGKKVEKDACRDFGYDPEHIPVGVVVGEADIVDCVQFPSPKAPPDEYGDFCDGRWGFLLVNVKKYKRPIPAKGSLGIWEWVR